MTDFEGREIKAGDTIVYAVRKSSWMGLTRATVIRTGEMPVWPPQHYLVVQPAGKEKTVRLTMPTCVVVS